MTPRKSEPPDMLPPSTAPTDAADFGVDLIRAAPPSDSPPAGQDARPRPDPCCRVYE